MLWRAIVLSFAFFGVLVFAQENSDSEAAADAEQSETATEEASESATDEGFVPTKEVPADDEITFPVNI